MKSWTLCLKRLLQIARTYYKNAYILFFKNSNNQYNSIFNRKDSLMEMHIKKNYFPQNFDLVNINYAY